MTVLRTIFAATIAVSALAPLPASAQFYMKSYDFRGTTVRGDEAGLGVDLPDATDAELTAGLVWSLRAALNIAALQCQFEPTLLTVPQYNMVMRDHAAELKSTYDTLTKYFARKNKVPRAGQTALDQFGTRVYGSFSTAGAQYGFCQTASNVGRAAMFAAHDRQGAAARDAQFAHPVWRAALRPRHRLRRPPRAAAALRQAMLEEERVERGQVRHQRAVGDAIG
jgi:hypothetical protein